MSEAPACGRCGQSGPGRRFRFRDGGDEATRCLRCSLQHPSLVGRAGRVALVVGSILTLINHGNMLIGGVLSLEMLVKIPLTYFVPYAVSTYSTLGAVRVSSQPLAAMEGGVQ